MKQTREKIIAAARSLFEEKGFAATTTKQLAALAGVSEVTLFRHFASKRGLFDETVHSCMHPYSIEEYLTDAVTYDLRTDLLRIAYDMKDTFSQNASLLRMVMRDKIRKSEPEQALRKKDHSLKSQLLTYFCAMQETGRLDAEPKMALQFFFTNVIGYLMHSMIAGGHKIDEKYFAWMLDKVIDTLAGKDNT